MLVTEDDYKYMGIALEEAHCALTEGEIPIGAVIVNHGKILGKGHNLTERLWDVTAHAEMQAITASAATIGGKYLTDCTLYVTVEPCLMCAGAIGWAQISRIVIGCLDPKRGYSLQVNHSPFHPKCEIVSGVREAECRELMQSFFKSKR